MSATMLAHTVCRSVCICLGLLGCASCSHAALHDRTEHEDEESNGVSNNDHHSNGSSLLVDVLHPNLSAQAPGRTINVLRSPVPLPSVLATPESLPAVLAFLGEVPSKNVSEFSSSGDQIGSLLKTLAGEIRIGVLNVEPDPLLFDDEGDKTAGFVAYEKLLARIAELEKSKINKTPSEVALIDAEIDSLRSRWAAKPGGPAIALAVKRFRSRSQTGSAEFLEAWRMQLKTGSHTVGFDWDAIARPTNWRTLVASNNREGSYALSTNLEGSATQLIIQPGDVRLSMRYRDFAVSHPGLPEEALSSPLWDTEEHCISNGGMASGKTELVPRYVSHAVVCRELEIMFDSDSIWNKVKTMIGKDGVRVIEFGGLHLPAESIWTGPRLIILTTPCIVGVQVVAAPRSPSPDPQLKFEENDHE